MTCGGAVEYPLLFRLGKPVKEEIAAMQTLEPCCPLRAEPPLKCTGQLGLQEGFSLATRRSLGHRLDFGISARLHPL